MTSKPPVVMCFAGSDPTGGAGIEADILTLASLGCHAAPVITAVTAQDTNGLKQFTAVDTELVIAQARAVLEDMPVAAFKTGMLANSANVTAISTIIGDYPDLPLIVDPVFCTEGGDPLVDEPLEDVLRSLLLPHATLVTPNINEIELLAPNADALSARAQELLSLGCRFVLVTGTHENSVEVVNRLYGENGLLETIAVERLPKAYHGSGCTLAAACSAVFAHGSQAVDGILRAVDYTWWTLRRGYRLGMGQHLPNRLYWSDVESSSRPLPKRKR